MKRLLIIIPIFMYIIAYKLIFITYGEMFQYVINPLVWIIFSLIYYYSLYLKKYPYFKDKKDVIYIVVSISLLYVIVFYSLGFIFGFSKNPYSTSTSGIVINSFSILLVLGLKEFIRGVLVNETKDNKEYLFIIFLMFSLYDINFNMNIDSLFTIFDRYIIPIVATNIFCTYLVKKGSYISSALYRMIIFIPTIVVSILPKFNWIIPTLFDTLVPVIAYIFIEYNLGQKNKFIPNIKEEFRPSNWAHAFVVTILIIIFILGGFGVKPIVVVSASMTPYIYPGDLLLIGDCTIDNININDIIQFKMEDYTVVHRVVKIKRKLGNIELITKGDNNIREDRYPVTENNLLGCFKYKIPYIGYPSYIVRKIFSNK
jgi:signal peptidase